MRLVAAFLAFTSLLAGCNAYDTYSDGLKHSESVEAEMKEMFSLEPFVGFSWENGSLMDVTVAFTDIPAGLSVEEVAASAKQSVRRHFSETPRQVTISFTVQVE